MRSALVSLFLAVTATLVPATSSQAVTCPAPPAADLTTPAGWRGYLAEHPADSAYYLDDGLGRRDSVVAHRAGRAQPLASAVKVVHLAAYARAVATDRLDPRERVTVGEWERWWIPGTDGGAHLAALERLGIPATETGATDPADTVTLKQMVSAMIRESDNAVPDYLRDRLGDRALTRAAASGGWQLDGLPTLAGQTIGLLDADLPRRDWWTAAIRYAEDPAYRAEVLAETVTAGEVRRWVDTTYAATPRDLAGLYLAVATGDFGPGSRVALRQLEWQPPPDGLRGVGFKGGSFSVGVLTDAFEVRRTDGTVAVAVLLNRGMSSRELADATSEFAQQSLLVGALLDREQLGLLRCVA